MRVAGAWRFAIVQGAVLVMDAATDRSPARRAAPVSVVTPESDWGLLPACRRGSATTIGRLRAPAAGVESGAGINHQRRAPCARTSCARSAEPHHQCLEGGGGELAFPPCRKSFAGTAGCRAGRRCSNAETEKGAEAPFFGFPLASRTWVKQFGAGNETRTRDLNLGKVALYQLSYSRLGAAHSTCLPGGALALSCKKMSAARWRRARAR